MAKKKRKEENEKKNRESEEGHDPVKSWDNIINIFSLSFLSFLLLPRCFLSEKSWTFLPYFVYFPKFRGLQTNKNRTRVGNCLFRNVYLAVRNEFI